LLASGAANEQLGAANLIRKAGASELDWLDELVDWPADYRGTSLAATQFFVLGKIDEILSWEKANEQAKDGCAACTVGRLSVRGSCKTILTARKTELV
jgi:hypothetical protein